jgi:hypothetical protein
MVIHQFNKLIRNKWVWGVFAIIVSAAFCFEDLFSTREREETARGSAGTLAGEEVKASLFSEIADDIRGIGRQRDWSMKTSQVNLNAWRNYAAIKVAEKDGIEATDDEVAAAIRRDSSFQVNGGFSFSLYQRLLRENSLTPERFEAFLKRRLTLSRIGDTLLGAAAWSSPMELDQAVADMTDVFTVKVARFTQDRKAADKIKVDDAALRKWYDENTNSIALPERVRIRYVKFDATKKEILSKMVVTEDEMKDRYDVTIDRYTSTDTNGVESVKKFEEVKGEIEKELRRLAAVQFYETNINHRVYSKKAAKGASRLDEIAKEEGLKVELSDWFAVDGSYKEGFMKRSYQICSGAKGFLEAVAELEADSEDLRYAVVSSDSKVWLIEKAETSPKHIPTFEEAKKAIRPRALNDAKAKAFKAEIEAKIAKGVKTVLAEGQVSTNLTFSVSDLGGNAFDDQMLVARAAMKLKKGELSGFELISTGRALVVVCENRVDGDAAKAMVMRSRIAEDVSMLQRRQIPEDWMKWNLERLGFVPNDISYIEEEKEEE